MAALNLKCPIDYLIDADEASYEAEYYLSRPVSRKTSVLRWVRVNGVKLGTRAGGHHERLRQWNPETAAEARERSMEVIELADQDLLDVGRSRAAEQKVLPGEIWLPDKDAARKQGDPNQNFPQGADFYRSR